MTERFLLRQDQSSHWYVIPEDKAVEWARWEALDEDDEAAWDAPEWATEIGDPCHILLVGSWSRR